MKSELEIVTEAARLAGIIGAGECLNQLDQDFLIKRLNSFDLSAQLAAGIVNLRTPRPSVAREAKSVSRERLQRALAKIPGGQQAWGDVVSLLRDLGIEVEP